MSVLELKVLEDDLGLRDGQQIEQLQKRIRLLEAVVNNFPGGLLLFDGENRLVLCNEQQRRLLEYPDELFSGENPSLEQIFRINANRGEYGEGDIETIVAARMDLVAKRCVHVFERTRPNGTVLEIRGVPLAEGGFVTTYLDVTEQRKSQSLIHHLAHHDHLTTLPNRMLMLDRLKVALAGVKRGHYIALHYIDLDKFKPINDRHGHKLGDMVLKKVASGLLRSVRETDTVARIGGDEFVIIQVDLDAISGAKTMADRVLKNISETHFVEDMDLTVSASVGIACSPWDGDTPDELLRKADLAMYRSKNRGPGQTSFFSQQAEQKSESPHETVRQRFLTGQNGYWDAAS
jgi:diguanylate cyclase (GGDEF)-like protein